MSQTISHATVSNSVSGNTQTSAGHTYVSACAAIGGGFAQLYGVNATFTLTAWDNNPDYIASRLNKAATLQVRAILGTVAGNTLQAKLFDASGTLLGSASWSSTTSTGSYVYYGFSIAVSKLAQLANANCYVQLVQTAFASTMTVDEVRLVFVSAYTSLDLAGTMAVNDGGWLQASARWQYTASTGASSVDSPALRFTFPAAGLNVRATLVGTSFLFDERAWNSSSGTPFGPYLFPNVIEHRWPLASPASNTPAYQTTPSTFGGSNVFQCHGAWTSAAPNTRSMEFGFIDNDWTQGAAGAGGGYVPDLGKLNAGTVALTVVASFRSITAGYGNPVYSIARNPTLRIYYDPAPLRGGMFAEF